MFEIRRIIQQLRQGASNREVARALGVGRNTVAGIRAAAQEAGWLGAGAAMPEDAELAAHFKRGGGTARQTSSVEPWREELLTWHAQGVSVAAMRHALERKYGYAGSVHALYRLLRQAGVGTPAATVHLDFAAGEMAQVDFGSGPEICEGSGGRPVKTWVFV
ncbi:MAG: helix-turn-helix domain-containing protein, partial [Rhodocyclaceae bacterium]|nr:helix-turn-helix domain-containing protein [Rhodocyclaceae bacterium]